MHPLLLNDILIIVLLSVVVLYVCQRMHLQIIVGFLLPGVIAGPPGLGLVREVEAVKALAEAGIVPLLFTIGIEFSFRSRLQIRKTVLLDGSLQIGMTTPAGFAAARLFGFEKDPPRLRLRPSGAIVNPIDLESKKMIGASGQLSTKKQ